MTNNYFTTCIAMLFTVLVVGQNYDITGRLVDETTAGIPFANIVLKDAETQQITTGTTTDAEGRFLLENVAENKYILKISYLGFENKQFTLTVNSNIDLGNIEISTTQEELDEVVVTGRKPTVELKADRLVFNVENSTLSDGDTWQLLSKTPTLVEISGELLVKGRDAPTIYINDRKVYLSSEELRQFLESTPANVIKSVEVITNPPARYEAAGGAVINIITTKNLIAGYNGSLFGSSSKGILWRNSIGTNHYFKAKGVNFFTSYNYANRHYRARFVEEVTFSNNLQPYGKWSTNTTQQTRYEEHSLNSNVDFQLSENQSLGFSANLFFNPHYKRTTNAFTEATNVTDQTVDSTFFATNKILRDGENIALNANYAISLNDEGQKLSADVFYIDARRDPTQRVSTLYNITASNNTYENRFINIAGQDTKIYAGQLDYVLPSESSIFETGIKATKVETTSAVDQNRLQGNSPEFQDLFEYNETNLAAYVSYEKEWKKWSLKLGLRGENTSLKGISFSENQTNTQEYFQLFPTFYLLNNVTDNYSWNLQYSRRIDRPNYGELNPFKYYLNDNSFQVGNPKLQPSINDKVTFGQTIKNHTFELYYSQKTDPSYLISFQDNDNQEIQYIYANVEKNINFGIDYFSYLTITNNWSINTVLSYFYDEDQFIAIEDNNELLKNDRWAAYVSINHYFTFLKDQSLTADIWMYYLSPISWGGTGTQSELKTVDVSVTKTFWDRRASLTISALDVFNTFGKLRNTNKYLSQNHFKQAYYDQQSIGISFRYKFGNFKLSTNQKGIDLDEKDRIN